MPMCQAFGCVNRPSATLGKRFFAIPDPKKDPERCKQWLHAIGTDKFMFTTYSFTKSRLVCEDHFEESCFVRNMAAEFGLRQPKKTLKADAVPTIFIHKNRQSTAREASERRSAALEKMELHFTHQLCDTSVSIMKVQGLVALITGGASGFGKGFAEALLQKGARAVSLVDISDGKTVVDEFSNKFGPDRVMYHKADVRSDSEMENAFAKTMEDFKQLDVVCNNAGVANEIADWKNVIDINLTAVLRGTFLAKKYMDKKAGGNGGVVINVSSMAGFLYIPFFPVYNASKHGVIGYSRSLAMPGGDGAFGLDNIRINMVCPSFADTPILKKGAPHLSPEDFKAFKDSLPMVPVSDVVAAYMRLVEEDLHGEAVRITKEKGIDFHKFKEQLESDPSKIVIDD